MHKDQEEEGGNALQKKKPKGDGGSKTFEAHLRQMSLLSSLRDLLCGYGWCGDFSHFSTVLSVRFGVIVVGCLTDGVGVGFYRETAAKSERYRIGSVNRGNFLETRFLLLCCSNGVISFLAMHTSTTVGEHGK